MIGRWFGQPSASLAAAFGSAHLRKPPPTPSFVDTVGCRVKWVRRRPSRDHLAVLPHRGTVVRWSSKKNCARTNSAPACPMSARNWQSALKRRSAVDASGIVP